MKKKYFMMAVAAIFLLATISACSNKGKSAPETDDEELVDEDEDDDENDVALEYVSQDLGTFDLYGHVRSVEYEQAGMAEVTLRFDSKGNLADTSDPVGLWSIDSKSKDWVRTATYKAFCDALKGQ